VEPDPTLRRIERTAVVVCLLFAAAAFVLARFDPRPALGVLGGGVLILVSYVTIRAAVGGLVTALARPAAPVDGAPVKRQNPWITASKLGVRYALLALLAYVMIARLRLHPVGLLVGASSVVAAAAVEAARLLRNNAGTSTLDR
jgi:hypothetical protein